jgi:acyl-coenzyme A thioesterase PaaI-like protein
MPPVKCWKTSFDATSTTGDFEKIEIKPAVDDTRNNHFIHSHLLRMSHFVEGYDLYRPNGKTAVKEVLVAVLRLGPNLAGYPNLIHGGATALLFDDVVGFATDWMLQRMSMSFSQPRNAVTAHLSVDFIAGLPLPSTILMPVRLMQPTKGGPKLWFISQITNVEQTIVYAQAKVLYMLPRASL